MAEFDANYAIGNYSAAAAVADEEAAGGGGDELMWRLMSGSAHRMAGDGAAAIREFDVAEDVMIRNNARSVFSGALTGAWAMMYNDGAFAYDGGGQDRIFACLYKAIEYAASGNAAAARTEFNRANQHQENWLFERRGDIAAAQERMNRDAAAYQRENGGGRAKDNSGAVAKAFADSSFAASIRENCGFDTATSGVLERMQPVDWMNAYASHVAGVFRWLNGDNGREHLKDAAGCRRDNAVAARDFSECSAGARPRDQVWIWIEDGLCPARAEWRLDLPLGLIPYMNRYVVYAGMALPKLTYRGVAGYNWTAGGARAAELVDVDSKIKLEYDVYFRGALAREITRVLVKVGSQVALGVSAENLNDRNTAAVLQWAQLFAAVWSASTTKADTRSWTALPKKVHVARIDRPGNGVVTISNSGGVVARLTLPQGNSMVFVAKPTAQAAASIRIVTYP